MKIVFGKGLRDPSLSAQKASVFTTWKLSFEELSDDARHLLHICAFLSNEDIPEELFRRGKRAIGWMMDDEDRLDDAVEMLLNFSLVKRKESTDGFWMHPLVNAWARGRNDGITRRQNAEDAITLIAYAIDVDYSKKSVDDWISQRRILSHLNVCQAYVSENSTETHGSLRAAKGFCAIAAAFKEFGFYKEAEESYRNALAVKEKALGEDDPDTLATVNDIALVFDKQGRYKEAVEFYQRALIGQEKVLGKDHSSTLITLNNMASVKSSQGHGEEASSFIRGHWQRKRSRWGRNTLTH
ncbi:hypothetical protein RUND412_007199 [Rhizina undulata]